MPKTKNIIIFTALIALLFVLLAWPKIANPYRKLIKTWKATGVDCINEGVTPLAQHIHPTLKITIDGAEEEVPPDIGIVRGCTAELHTHDGTGQIHVESPRADEKFTFSQFLIIWGKSLEREGYSLKLTADGVEVKDPKDIVLKDKQEIVVEYTSRKTSDQ